MSHAGAEDSAVLEGRGIDARRRARLTRPIRDAASAADEKPRRPFLTAEWRHLVMLNYRVPAKLLEPWLPPDTELDYHEGDCYASIVGFMFHDTRVLGLPAIGHRSFEEINLRFYVRRMVAGRERRGVVFIRELVGRPLVLWIARWSYNEKYLTRPMRHAIEPLGDGASQQIDYQWREGKRWQGIRAVVEGMPRSPRACSLDEFIIEHYWGYGVDRKGRTLEYRVDHPPWRVGPRCTAELVADVTPVYGPDWAEVMANPPHSVLTAEGSPVKVYRPQRLDDAG